MIKIGMIGVMAALFATIIKKERAEHSMLIAIAAGMIIFLYVLSQISVVIGFISEMIEMVAIEETYYMQLLKMLGIAYVAEFASSICKDAGHQSISGMIELFAKLSIVALSIPGLIFLVETLERFV
ncbi:MAG: sporulation protein [Lachnospiraceae bacterium]|nr:sporulation protein [Lachnospiraceae bacterium]